LLIHLNVCGWRDSKDVPSDVLSVPSDVLSMETEEGQLGDRCWVSGDRY